MISYFVVAFNNCFDSLTMIYPGVNIFVSYLDTNIFIKFGKLLLLFLKIFILTLYFSLHFCVSILTHCFFFLFTLVVNLIDLFSGSLVILQLVQICCSTSLMNHFISVIQLQNLYLVLFKRNLYFIVFHLVRYHSHTFF